MSEQPVGAEECSSVGAPELALTAYPNRDASLGAIHISRALPIRDRRMVGPWCFLDRFGPLAFAGETPMDVPPHPHVGLQTVSWLLEGEVLHSDSLGYQATVRPGGVNVMTAGRGIAHAEETPVVNTGRLSGVQLWVALPEADLQMDPSFMHIEQVPVVQASGGVIQVFAGSYDGAVSPAPHFARVLD
jgi:quercetin 2,3-dioxygenase